MIRPANHKEACQPWFSEMEQEATGRMGHLDFPWPLFRVSPRPSCHGWVACFCVSVPGGFVARELRAVYRWQAPEVDQPLCVVLR